MYSGAVGLGVSMFWNTHVGRALDTTAFSETGWPARDVEALALGAAEVPALQMADQQMRLVLRGHAGRRMPEFRAFDGAKSMMRVLPPEIDGRQRAGRSAPSGGCRDLPPGHLGHGVARGTGSSCIGHFTSPARYSGAELKHDRRQRRREHGGGYTAVAEPGLPRRRRCLCRNRRSPAASVLMISRHMPAWGSGTLVVLARGTGVKWRSRRPEFAARHICATRRRPEFSRSSTISQEEKPSGSRSRMQRGARLR